MFQFVKIRKILHLKLLNRSVNTSKLLIGREIVAKGQERDDSDFP